MHQATWFLRSTALALALTACQSPSTSSTAAQTACNPLAAPPTTLATVFAVGKDSAGTLYVADHGGDPALPSTVRLFVETQGSLVRQSVLGSGQSGDFTNGQNTETFQSPDGSNAPRDITIQIEGGKATSMTLGSVGSGKATLEGMDGGAATQLTILDPSAVPAIPVIDVPGVVLYVADGGTSQAIVVTAPLDDDQGTVAVHLFYGTPGAMVERHIVNFNQALSGYPDITFTVGASTYDMSISSVPAPDGGPFPDPGPVTLTTGSGAPQTFTLRQPTPKSLPGFTFTCLGT